MQTAGVWGNWVTSCDSQQKAENSLRAGVSSFACVWGPNLHPSAVFLPWFGGGGSEPHLTVLASFWAAAAASSPIPPLCITLCSQQQLQAWLNLQIITFRRRYLWGTARGGVETRCVDPSKGSSPRRTCLRLAHSLNLYIPTASQAPVWWLLVLQTAAQFFAYLHVHCIYSHI